MKIDFNRVVVIESLGYDDELTGTNLHKDLLSRESNYYKEFQSILKTPKTKEEFFAVFKEITEDCNLNHNAPIIHFEIHGSEKMDGLVLSSGELVEWEELRCLLTPINIIQKNSLFVTMAVCHGNYSLLASHACGRAPFRGILGSFNSVETGDVEVRFNAFYQELFESLDINKAYKRLVDSNPDITNTFTCYSADYIFARSYSDYINKDCNEAAVRKRAEETWHEQILCKKVSNDRNEHARFIERFKMKERETRVKYFEESYTKFFMIDKYPEIAESIGYPMDIKEMQKWLEDSL